MIVGQSVVVAVRDSILGWEVCPTPILVPLYAHHIHRYPNPVALYVLVCYSGVCVCECVCVCVYVCVCMCVYVSVCVCVSVF